MIQVDIFPSENIADPTGVGDAYRAGFIYGITADWPLELAGQVGALCATYVLEHIGTQNHRYTIPDFISRFRSYYEDQGILDQLLGQADSAAPISQ